MSNSWTPEHEVSRWREFVAALVLTRHLYGYDHKRMWDAIDNLEDALDGFDSKLRQRMIDLAKSTNAPPLEAWPDNLPRRYNGSGEPCDMWTGPCQCGATHFEGK